MREPGELSSEWPLPKRKFDRRHRPAHRCEPRRARHCASPVLHGCFRALFGPLLVCLPLPASRVPRAVVYVRGPRGIPRALCLATVRRTILVISAWQEAKQMMDNKVTIGGSMYGLFSTVCLLGIVPW